MDPKINRKSFCKNLALYSVAAMGYPTSGLTQILNDDEPKSNHRSTSEKTTKDALLLPGTILFVNVKDFGARGNGITDDTESIQRAVRSNALIFFPAGHYRVSKTIKVRTLQNVHIWAIGAIISNSTLTNHLFQIEQCEFVTINGGKFTREATPTALWPTDRHCLYITHCKDIVVQDILIDGSPGMGICILNGENVKILNNNIRNTTRDGVYSHYSVNVIYSGNYLENILDDALSMHDYGFKVDKQLIIADGYQQAGSSSIAHNRIRNCMRGIASIGLQSLTITDNVIDHVVTCGIEVYNTAEQFEGPDTQVQDVLISNNLVTYACQDNLEILGKLHNNGNQGGGGKAAITVGSFSADYQYATGSKRLANISVTGNMVNHSAADAYFLNNIDGLIFSNNSARDCNTSPFPPYTGYIVECWSCTGLCGFNNNVVDSSSPQKALAGYRILNTTGSIGGWLGLQYVVHAESTTVPRILY